MIVDITEWDISPLTAKTWNGDAWRTRLYEMKVWCDYHCDGRWHRSVANMEFEFETDALLFILRWKNVL